MKILNINNSKIKACFVFVVGNSEISVSTIFNENKAEIAIFDRDSGNLEKDNLPNSLAAISWVENFGNRS